MAEKQEFYAIKKFLDSRSGPERIEYVTPWIVEGDSTYIYGAVGSNPDVKSLGGMSFSEWHTEQTKSDAEFISKFNPVAFMVCEPQINFGCCYPRLARPRTNDSRIQPPENQRAKIHLEVQLEVFSQSVKDILQNIEPIPEHLTVFGHKIRNLLLLAATEVEAQLKGILKANNYNFAVTSGGQERATTNDYVKLCDPLHLKEYQVQLTYTPELEPRSPFRDWDPSSPTQSLRWYEAYNQVKHDREAQFQAATLENALDAVIACDILRQAQYYCDPYFEHVTSPTWHPSEYYTNPPSQDIWSHTDWTLECFPF